MGDVERVLGELKEFKRATLKELDYIRKDIHNLNVFKWKIAGISSLLVGSIELIHLLVLK